ncbi:MAG: asparagine synthase-related protein [Candidatus Thermoplasmatota archaeon]|nr:asparagine synthase-related protein [Candidatus Thermoplasmatota archaeon]
MMSDAEKRYTSDIAAALASAIRGKCEGKRVAVPFSGGIDSSLVAFLLKPFASEVRLYVVGTGNHSPDIEAAHKAAEFIGLPIEDVIVSENEIETAAKEVESIIKSASGFPSILQISFELPLYFAARAAAAGGYNFLATGQGADELFGGYSRYSAMSIEEFAKSSNYDSMKLKESGINIDKAVAAKFGAELFCPFLEDGVFSLARNIPPELKIKDGVRKHILRAAAASLGLPEEISQRKKKAAQYGSGIMKVLERLQK